MGGMGASMGGGGTTGADWRVQLADYASSRLKDEEVSYFPVHACSETKSANREVTSTCTFTYR